MKPFRVLTMLAVLVASAAAAHAQTPPPIAKPAPESVWQSLPDGSYEKWEFGVGAVKPLSGTLSFGSVKSNPPPCCAESCESSWLVKAVRSCAASCQRLGALCARGQATRECPAAPAHGLCPAAGVVTGSAVCAQACDRAMPMQFPYPLTGCEGAMTGGFRVYTAPQPATASCCDTPAERVRAILLNGPECRFSDKWAGGANYGGFFTPWDVPCAEIKDFIQFVQTKAAAPSAPCCCAKACACCESCKAKAQAQWVPAPPMGRVIEVRPATPATSARTAACPMQCAPAQTWIAPPVPHMPVARTAPKLTHFVTPELEGHCERMTSRGDIVILEGNVMLLSKKHARPMRIEAQRVLINMKDGSFTVDNDTRTGTVSSFGAMRTSAEMPITHRIITVLPMAAPPRMPPAPRVIKVEGKERIFLGEIPPIPGR